LFVIANWRPANRTTALRSTEVGADFDELEPPSLPEPLRMAKMTNRTMIARQPHAAGEVFAVSGVGAADDETCFSAAAGRPQ